MLNKGDIVYVVQEAGQADRVFTDQAQAILALQEPLLGAEKILVKWVVQRKRVRVITEQEVN